MNLQRSILFLLFFAFCIGSSANAQECSTADAHKYFVAGSDTIIKIFITPTRDGCYIFRQHIVLEVALKSEEDAPDRRIVVRKRVDDKDLDCSLPDKKQELLTIRGESLFGLYRHFVFTDEGTGPDGRIIAIYDLEKKKQVYSAVYSPSGKPSIKGSALLFYKDLSELKHKRHCPNAEKWRHRGLDYSFEQKTRLDLDSLLEKGIGSITCSERQ